MTTTATSDPRQVGYWLLDLEDQTELWRLISSPRLAGMTWTVLCWLASEVTACLDLESRSLPVKVIEAHYVGAPYPCLAVEVEHGREIPQDQADELEADIEREVARLLAQTPVAVLLKKLSAGSAGHAAPAHAS